MPNLRQLLLGALLLALAIAVVAGIALRGSSQPLERPESETPAAQMYSVDMGVSADLDPSTDLDSSSEPGLLGQPMA